MHSFQKLKVYQKALAFTKTVRALTRKFPSAHECIGCLDIALTNEYISEKNHKELFEEIDEIIAMLVGLQRSLLR